jgi:hypothetical protein
MNDQTARDRSAERLLLSPETKVTCPRCEHEFSLAEGFAKQSLEQLEAASHGALERMQAEARAAEERRARERASKQAALLQQQLKDSQALLEQQQKQHAESLAKARAFEKQAADQAQADMREQLQAQAKQLDDFRKAENRLRKERAELEARQQQLELEVQRKLDEERKQIADSARGAEAERAKLREADLQKKLDDMRHQLDEAQRKAEQGSQQAQGEVLEVILEEQLGVAFPIDVIEEVRKGARGGDVVQKVMTRSGQRAGTMLWEAKRAQNWSAAWPAKLMTDMRDLGAEAGVIVTTSFPNGWPTGQLFGLHEEVWVTSPSAAIPLASALRAGLLEAFKARVASANKGEKMEAVYDYLTSPQFAHKLKAVYLAFRKMREELETERTTMQQRWNRRIKQIDQATVQLVGIAGDLQGLAQQELPQLEMETGLLEGPGEVGED